MGGWNEPGISPNPPDPRTRACREAGAAANGLGVLAVTQAAGAGCRQQSCCLGALPSQPTPDSAALEGGVVLVGKAEQSVFLGESLSSSMCTLWLLGAWE